MSGKVIELRSYLAPSEPACGDSPYGTNRGAGLHLACIFGDLATVRYLLDRGADVGILDGEPLRLAVAD
jgi:ankyrin repeat protein